MNRLTLGYGVFNLLFQRQRMSQISSQYLTNLNNGNIINPKDEIFLESPTEFQTEDKKGTIGLMTKGKFTFHGIGKVNSKCLIETNENQILAYSKGDYNIKIIAPNIKKIKLKSLTKTLTICYWNYPINEISNIISDYFKDDKITKILNLTDNLDENWNDILSITLNNSVYNNDFTNPKIEIISNKSNISKDISEISNRYNFMIILKNFKENKNEIIDDPLLISIISQDHHKVKFDPDSLLIWIMQYIEHFTLSSGKFFKYYESKLTENEKKDFIDFVIAHKISSLYLKVDSEDEIKLVESLNNIIESNNNMNNIITNSIIKYGLVKENNSYYYSYTQYQNCYNSYY